MHIDSISFFSVVPSQNTFDTTLNNTSKTLQTQNMGLPLFNASKSERSSSSQPAPAHPQSGTGASSSPFQSRALESLIRTTYQTRSAAWPDTTAPTTRFDFTPISASNTQPTPANNPPSGVPNSFFDTTNIPNPLPPPHPAFFQNTRNPRPLNSTSDFPRSIEDRARANNRQIVNLRWQTALTQDDRYFSRFYRENFGDIDPRTSDEILEQIADNLQAGLNPNSSSPNPERGEPRNDPRNGSNP